MIIWNTLEVLTVGQYIYILSSEKDIEVGSWFLFKSEKETFFKKATSVNREKEYWLNEEIKGGILLKNIVACTNPSINTYRINDEFVKDYIKSYNRYKLENVLVAYDSIPFSYIKNYPYTKNGAIVAKCTELYYGNLDCYLICNMYTKVNNRLLVFFSSTVKKVTDAEELYGILDSYHINKKLVNVKSKGVSKILKGWDDTGLIVHVNLVKMNQIL